MKRSLLPLWLLLFSLSLIGCVSLAGGGPQSVWLTVFLVALLAWSCTQVLPGGEKTGETTPTDGSVKDLGKGVWESCCKDGKISKCFCPDGMACNYGVFNDCGNGTCKPPREQCEQTNPDAGPDKAPDVSTDKAPDASPDVSPDTTPEKKGTWEKCCKDGKVSRCFCPAGAACNYGQYKDCGGGVCVPGGGSCEPTTPDAGPDKAPDVSPDTTPEKKGTWEKCCKNGKVDQCFCPAGVACNYGVYKDCGAGVCVPNARFSCPEPPKPEVRPEPPPPERKGTWQRCCKNGKIDQCFCPQGMACNYGMFKDCGAGKCILPGQKCP